MADYAESEGSDERRKPPPELQEAWVSKQWGLPEAGGRLDQPAGLVLRMTVAHNVYAAMRGFRAASNIAKWCDQNPDSWAIVRNVMDLRKQTHAD